MSTSNKRRLLYAALICLTLWPLVQIGLVERYDVNPWKFGGWGMYSAPQLVGYVRVFGRAEGTEQDSPLLSLDPTLQARLDRFLRLRRGLRKLVRPDDLGRSILDHYPLPQVVTIVVVQPVLNRKNGMIEETQVAYEYRR